MSTYKPIHEIEVGLQFGAEPIPVGRLAMRENKVYFEYHTDFLKQNLHISPFRLPLEPGLQSFDTLLFEGLPGVFNDSLPDGWGRLLMDRFFKSQGILFNALTPLDRLALVGNSGLGALTYRPDHSEPPTNDPIDLNLLATQTQEVLKGDAEDVLEELIALNGSSTGARPKALVGVDSCQENLIHGKHDLPKDYEHWIVKFPNSADGPDAGAIEYVYALMAKEAGISMTETHLFASDKSPGYFATKRFDRHHNQRLHMHTASGLLHSDFRVPVLDYETMIELTHTLTRDVREVEKMFRLAVFNVLAHNRDDHGKNFSFLMSSDGDWKLSPAYDITFSSGPRGHQSTMVLGEGQKPTIEHLIKLGEATHLKKATVVEIIDQTKEALSNWESLAAEFGVKQANIKLIKSRILV